jgi:hypothetical protein
MILKIVRIFITVYVIRFIIRFLQNYQAVRIKQQDQEAELNRRKKEPTQTDTKIVEADFKVVDR